MRVSWFLLCALCLVSVDAEARRPGLDCAGAFVDGSGRCVRSMRPEEIFAREYSDGMSVQGMWLGEYEQEVDEKIARAVTRALAAQLSEVSCELPEQMNISLLLLPNGRREYLVGVYQSREQMGRVSPAQGLCLGQELERMIGPRFMGAPMVMSMVVARGLNGASIKDVRWVKCGQLCGVHDHMPSHGGVLTDAMWDMMFNYDVRLNDAILIEYPRLVASTTKVDLALQICMREGFDKLATDEQMPRLKRQWFAVQRVFCAARWGRRDAPMDAHVLSDERYQEHHYRLVRVLSKWRSGQVGDLLALWRSEGSFIGVAELGLMLSEASMSPLLAYSPWVLHARGALLERLDPTRHDEAVALVKLAALLAAPEQRDEYERHAAFMGASEPSDALVRSWVERQQQREAQSARALKELDAWLQHVAGVRDDASESLHAVRSRAHQIVSVRREEPRPKSWLSAQELTWLQKLLLAAIAAASLVLGWIVLGRVSRR